jgi:hypothetical protein
MAGIKKIVKGSHLVVTHYDNGEVDLQWNWKALERDVATAIKGYELNKMDKKELEEYGRFMGIELDRRKKKEALIKQLMEKIFPVVI